MSIKITYACLLLLFIVSSSIAESVRTMTEAEQVMIDSIQKSTDLTFVGFVSSEPNDTRALFQPNEETIARLLKQGNLHYDDNGNMPKIELRLDGLNKFVNDKGPFKLSTWYGQVNLRTKIFFPKDVPEQVEQLAKLTSFSVTFDSTSNIITVRDTLGNSTSLLANQLPGLLKDVEKMGVPIIIPSKSGSDEYRNFRFEDFHKQWGMRLGKAAQASQSTGYVPDQGYATHLTRPDFKFGIISNHTMLFPGKESIIEWLSKPEAQDAIFNQQKQREEWLMKKGYVLKAIYLDHGGPKYRIQHHSKRHSTELRDFRTIDVDVSYEDFVRRVSKVNSDFATDPLDQWMNSRESEDKREMRAAKRARAESFLRCGAFYQTQGL